MRILTVIALIACVAIATLDVQARKQRTTRSNINGRSATVEASVEAVDSFVIPDSAEVLLYGYDKPLRSHRETIFVTNNTRHGINAVAITAQYFDSKGRKFHQTHRRVVVEIPVGETRKVDFPSWDKQQSFYYVGSKRPRTSATPYDVALSVDTIFVNTK